jgi:ribonuclease P protein component
MAATYSYNKKEKLKSRKLLDQLFTKGRSFSVFPIKVFYMPIAEGADNPIKAGVGVSARNFNKAVHRNRIKRLLRECYRLHKSILSVSKEVDHKPFAVFFLFVGKEMPDFILLNEKMPLALTKLESIIA